MKQKCFQQFPKTELTFDISVMCGGSEFQVAVKTTPANSNCVSGW